MQINQLNNSMSFEAIGVQSSQMTKAQKNIAEDVYRAIEGSTKYQSLRNNVIDILILSGNKDKSVTIKFLDRISGKLMKNNTNKKTIQFTYPGYGNKYSFSDKIIAKYNEVLNPDFPKPKINFNEILKYKTDLAKLNPELNDLLVDEYNDLISEGFGKESSQIIMYNVFTEYHDYDF